MSQWFIYVASCGFAFGIFIRSFYELSYELLVGVLFVSGFFAVLWARQQSRRSFATSLFILCLVIGVVRFDATSWTTNTVGLEASVGEEVVVQGVVIREPEVRERTTHLYVDLDVYDTTLLLFADRTSDIAYGDQLTVTGKLQVPDVFETDLGRSFNYPGYLRARGVTYTIFFPEITVVEPGRGNFFIAALLTFKHQFMRSVEAIIPEPQVGLGEGLLLGVKSALGEELEMVFRRTGIIHIVVLSGYNVMLVVVFVMTILSFLFGLRTRLVFGVGAIVSFALMVGLSATVVRASIMAVLILIARATGRSYAVLRALFLAGFLMLLVNPYLLVYDAGFQLSFVATLGLILLSPQFDQWLVRVPTVIGVREFLVATLTTQIAVLPLLLYQIGEFSVVAVLVNVLVLPMVPVAMLLTFLTGMVGLFSSALALPLGYMTYLSLSYILIVATWFAALPFASFVVPPFPFWLMVLLYMVLAFIAWCMLSATKSLAQQGADSLADWTIVSAEKKIDSGKRESISESAFFR